MSEEPLFFNGIDAATGEYLLPPLTAEQVSKIACDEEFDPGHLSELKKKDLHVKGIDPDFAPIEGVDPKKLEETGWGVIFAYNADPAIREALSELLEHRKKQATQKHEHYYQEYIGVKGYRPGESKSKFLSRHKLGPGPADPDKMPYYLLIVGDPETIPYTFQYQLDVQYAVGRIYFEHLEEYAQYARSVVEAETGKVSLPRRASFFGVRNHGDKATQLSADNLIQPLAEWMAQNNANWDVKTILKEEATRARLTELVGGKETPAFLFTASHGVGLPNGDPRQIPHQGALLCQDWPGPFQWKGPIDESHYFSADKVGNNARLLGLIAFHFACYGAGTPKLDDFSHQKAFTQRSEIAPHAFVARLPQQLLSHPKGGALAVVGHVERAWGCSFVWERTGKQLAVFQSSLKRLLDGYPVGYAIEYFNERYAELSSDLSHELHEIKHGAIPDELQISGMWTANNDARSYCVIGDPAVRLLVSNDEVAQNARPVIEKVKLPAASPAVKQPTKEAIAVVENKLDEEFDESVLKQNQELLIQTIDKFITTVEKAPEERAEPFEIAVSTAKTLLKMLQRLT